MPTNIDRAKLRFYFEPLPVPDDIADWQDWLDVCVRVPVPLIAYLTPIMRIWQSPGCLIASDMNKALFIGVWTDLIGRINAGDECEPMIRLRQNPANPCQLQQSHDGGTVWTLAFDYSKCLPIADTFSVEYNGDQTLTNYSNATTIEEIHPDAPSETFTAQPDDPPEEIIDRMTVLCAAVNLYVHAYVENVRALNADATSWANAGATVLSVAAALAALAIPVSAGSSIPLYLALAAAMGASGTASYAALTNDVLDNEDAITEVACLMYANLRNAATTQENFAGSVDGVLTGDAEIIRATLALDISNPDGLENQFNAFVAVLGDLKQPAELDAIDACPCDEPAYLVEVNQADCLGGGAGGAASITHVSGNTWDIELTPDIQGGFSAHFKDVQDRIFEYAHISGSVFASVILEFDNDCQYSGAGGGAVSQNQLIIKELTLYNAVSQTIRITVNL